ncbi:MAG: flagellar protein FlgN [Lachnospiraceae bacterium]|jgi:flagellar biosynthesis/type III secretory pathway chaperone|nr:flagellar protein FlgN [Lachnospiraceae bacterium]MEE3460591.1 flagellar protein FlgN [Lachnospiraceae bacterium]
MASLMDELTDTLDKECEVYRALIPISEMKTKALVDEDLDELQKATDQEREYLDAAENLEKKRKTCMKNMGLVLGKKEDELTLKALSDILAGQSEQQKKINELHDRLKKVMDRLVSVNKRNQSLIENNMEMVEYELNIMKSSLTPQDAGNNYTRNASRQTGVYDPGLSTTFDARQ